MDQIVPKVKLVNDRLIEKELSYLIIGAFYETYNELRGFGHAELTYANALSIALVDKGLRIQREHPVDVFFRGRVVGNHRLDILVEGRVILELKSTEKLADYAKRQVVNYLTASGLQLGILLHFGPKAEFFRVLNPALLRPDSPTFA